MTKTIITFILFVSFNFSYAQINKIDIDINSKESFHVLMDEFKDRKIIGVGEATHGTSEFFTFKASLFKFLVEELNFRNFAMEAQAGEALMINEFINGSEGEVDELIQNLNFWAWETEEVKELILWMREYNYEHNEKIHLFGFDMQLTHNSVYQLYDYFEKVDSVQFTQVKKVYKNYENPAYNFGYHKMPDVVKNENKKQLEEVHEYLKSHKKTLTKKLSLEEWQNALYLSHVILESEEIFRYSYKERDELRDRAMAALVYNYTTIFGDFKTMIWAHNGHICKTEKYGKKTLGMYLNERFKDEYFSLGLLFNSGNFRAQKGNGYKVDIFTLKPAPKESFLYQLSEYGTSYYINFSSQPQLIYEKLNKEQYVYDVPANFKKRKSFTYKPFILTKNYDAIVFFNETNAAKPITTTNANRVDRPARTN